MTRLLAAIERILLTLWVGGLWVSGYLVVPTLFAALDDRMLAGELAGRIFTLMSWVGLACGGALLLALLLRERVQSLRAWRAWALVVMLALVAIGLFMLQPQMQALKAEGIVPGTPQAVAFGRLHGVSSVLFLINSVLGLVLVGAGLRPEARR